MCGNGFIAILTRLFKIGITISQGEPAATAV
jgi:hypothetical protein